MQVVLARWSRVLAAVAPIACAVGCDEDPARVTLAPSNGLECGRPMGTRNIRVTAFGRSGESSRALTTMEQLSVADFPSDTEQLGVEVEVGGGAVGAAGKTAPMDFLALDEGATIPIFMAPLDGYCATRSPMNEPRVAPLAARAGDGVLIAGGHDGAGSQLTTAEYYDPVTATFVPVDVPEGFLIENPSAFAGASLTTLPDGRVALGGGTVSPQITVFDPVTREFGAGRPIDARVFHASIAVGDDRVLLAGGCAAVANGACAGVERLSSFTYAVDTGAPVVGPTLRAARIGATLFDVGVQTSGVHAYVMAGGTPRVTSGADQADRIAIGDEGVVDGELLDGVRAHVAQLDGGAVITAFALDGAPPDNSASVIAPGAISARPIAPAFSRSGARMIGLEDGTVLAIGGDPAGEVLTYNPTTDRWSSFAPRVDTTPQLDDGETPLPPPIDLAAPILTRLADGSVLVLGGTIAGAPSDGAWIYRPSIVGPMAGSVTAVPAGTSAVLTAADPASVSRVDAWELTGTDVPAHAIVGGPRMTQGTITATVRVREGGVGLLAQQMGPGRALVGELVPGQTARVVRLDGAARHILCSGSEIAARDPDAPASIRLEVTSDAIRLSLDGTVVATCSPDEPERGAWGVAALAGSRVAVDTVTVAR